MGSTPKAVTASSCSLLTVADAQSPEIVLVELVPSSVPRTFTRNSDDGDFCCNVCFVDVGGVVPCLASCCWVWAGKSSFSDTASTEASAGAGSSVLSFSSSCCKNSVVLPSCCKDSCSFPTSCCED